jgi:hypothetical protein
MDSGEREERCGACKWWTNHDAKNSDLGECRRYPPAMGLSVRSFPPPSGPDGPALDTVRPQDGGWPLTFPDDWCGEWAPVEKRST